MTQIIPSGWALPAGLPRLEVNEVHVWRAVLDLPVATLDRLRQCLTAEEIDLFSRLRLKTDQNRRMASRAILRTLLGGYLSRQAGEISLVQNGFGKPGLDGEIALRFNISHSNRLAVLAFADRREVGIDVEYMRPELCDMELARRYFAPREVSALQSLPAGQRQAAFFECWTRKEAYVKARGEGLSIPLDRFEVPVLPDEPLANFQVYGNPSETYHWKMWSLAPDPEYAMALVVEGAGWNARLYDWHAGLIDGIAG